jgi:hypothetical protein
MTEKKTLHFRDRSCAQNVIFYLFLVLSKHQTMNKVHEANDLKCSIASSESFRKRPKKIVS